MKVITFLEVVTQSGAKTKLVGRMNSFGHPILDSNLQWYRSF